VKNDERLKIYQFSDPLYHTNASFFYYKGDDRIKDLHYRTLSDLEGYSISGIRGYYYQKTLEESGLDVRFVTDELQNMRFLAAGRVDLILINSLVARYMIRTFFPEELQNNFGMVPGEYHSSYVYLIMDKDYPGGERIMERFNRSLERVKQKGTFKQLILKHGLN
jgi:polar amino acid transport system substrate-binding protein